MPSVTIKNIPDNVYERLRESARLHRRSINNEVIYFIENALLHKRIDPDDFLNRIQPLRKKLAIPPLTKEFLTESKNERRL